MKRPTAEQMRLAAEWLDVNEGDHQEHFDCMTVRDWLRDQADKADARAAAKEIGVSVGVMKKAAKRHGINI